MILLNLKQFCRFTSIYSLFSTENILNNKRNLELPTKHLVTTNVTSKRRACCDVSVIKILQCREFLQLSEYHSRRFGVLFNESNEVCVSIKSCFIRLPCNCSPRTCVRVGTKCPARGA